MTTTPPPPATPTSPSRSCLRTPPTPLHGPKYDLYQPYLVRQPTRAKTLQAADEVNRASLALHTVSPPPSNHSTPVMPKSRAFKTREDTQGASAGEAISAVSAANVNEMVQVDASSKVLASMLPTPAKTPRKQTDGPAYVPRSTARILFPPTEVYLPNGKFNSSPRLQRDKNRLGMLDGRSNGAFEIYMDPQERIPELDTSEENPFYAPKGESKAKGNQSKEKAKGEKTVADAELEEVLKREDGMVYVFRGKKFFRAFAKEDDLSDHDSGTTRTNMAGRVVGRMTPASIKPRLLFPTEEQLQQRQQRQQRAAQEQADATVDEEEAPTDIDEEALHRPHAHQVTASLGHEDMQDVQFSAATSEQAFYPAAGDAQLSHFPRTSNTWKQHLVPLTGDSQFTPTSPAYSPGPRKSNTWKQHLIPLTGESQFSPASPAYSVFPNELSASTLAPHLSPATEESSKATSATSTTSSKKLHDSLPNTTRDAPTSAMQLDTELAWTPTSAAASEQSHISLTTPWYSPAKSSSKTVAEIHLTPTGPATGDSQLSSIGQHHSRPSTSFKAEYLPPNGESLPTPAPPAFSPLTPPSSSSTEALMAAQHSPTVVRMLTRSHAKKLAEPIFVGPVPARSRSPRKRDDSTTTTTTTGKAERPSPFDEWRRTKAAAASAPKAMKRAAVDESCKVAAGLGVGVGGSKKAKIEHPAVV